MGQAPLTTDFTGRSRELAMLDELLAGARSGSGDVSLIRGEAGIGKTTFCREVVARARRTGFATSWGACWTAGGAPPLWPWRQILDNLSEGRAGTLLADDPGGTAVNPERFSRFAAVVHELGVLGRRQPLLIVIDDAHAADPGALLLARFVAHNVTDLRLVLMLTLRNEKSAPTGAFDLGSDVRMVELSAFGIEETADLLRSRGLATLDTDTLTTLVRLTGGHPLHLQRVLATAHGDALGDASFTGLQATIRNAIAQLGEASQVCLSRSAVLGPSIPAARAALVAETDILSVNAAVDEAVAAGLVERTELDPSRFSYAHELIREAFLDRLEREEQLACHARAAGALAPDDRLTAAGSAGRTGRDRLGRYAYHAVQAAPRSREDARAAIEACRAAAAAMVEGYAYEEAVLLLGNAVAVHEATDLPDPAAELKVERAEAILMCGRLAEARQHFDEAVTAAVAENDVVCLGRAAAGLGGVWVNEHRTLIEWDRVTGLQRRALARLPAEQRPLRLRLTMRLAVEELYRGGPIEPVLASLDEARDLGDGAVLAECLSLTHHALLTARHTWSRLPLAEELIAVAAPSGEGLLALFGLCWRTVDLFHLGDLRAARSWAELRERADAVGCLSVLHAAEAMGVMMLIRAGRLVEAEKQAEACYALGVKIGDSDAAGYLAAQLSTIRWFQGQEAQMAGSMAQLADSSSLNPAEFGFRATAARMMATAGDRDRASAMLSMLVEPGLDRLPDSSTWLAGMLGVIETARTLGDAAVCREAYALLEPYADLPIMPSLAVTCLGSAHRPLGLAALAAGEYELGVQHLRSALKANRTLGNRPLTAMTMADLAEAYLLDRAEPAARQQAVELLSAACEQAEAMGMTGHLDSWRRRLDAVRDDVGLIERHDGVWILRLAGSRAQVTDRLGMRYLAQLLANPGRSIAAAELAAGGNPVVGSGANQAVLDDQARAAYRRRLSELTAGLEQAEDDGDVALSEQLAAEKDALVDELRRVTGLGGRTRGFADSGERARTAVRKALMRAVDEITTVEPAIGKHLSATLTTGSTCCYNPDPAHLVRWRSTSSVS